MIKRGMDLRRYELATVAAARQLRSSHCVLAHGSVLIDKFLGAESVKAVVSNHRHAGLSEVDVAVMDLAEKVADDATSIQQTASSGCGPWGWPTRRSWTLFWRPLRGASSARRSTRLASSRTRSTTLSSLASATCSRLAAASRDADAGLPIDSQHSRQHCRTSAAPLPPSQLLHSRATGRVELHGAGDQGVRFRLADSRSGSAATTPVSGTMGK